MNICWHDLRTINELAASFAKREGVEALVLAGSTATGLADEESDYDLYAYTRETIADRNVHQTVFAPQRHRRFGAFFGQGKQPGAGASTHDNGERFFRCANAQRF